MEGKRDGSTEARSPAVAPERKNCNASISSLAFGLAAARDERTRLTKRPHGAVRDEFESHVQRVPAGRLAQSTEVVEEPDLVIVETDREDLPGSQSLADGQSRFEVGHVSARFQPDGFDVEKSHPGGS